ncbi:hypothetical protein [Alkalibacillus haloalkaliphilus]|uniref:Uncharacterized protein n=1 Tax=Alkalibacillus haloalkaliphilus TaxID=94136 RepID=A0A511W5B0_9BACI|nr:hypothetical protein [Alkalibacillus haloalkaliphilus]GEN45961.1 hypothetical protein AHA02nite_17370 [Alkalibacillus haloalkaliphilus]
MWSFVKHNKIILLSILFGVLPFLILRLLVRFNYQLPVPTFIDILLDTLVWVSVPLQSILLILGFRRRSNKVLLFIALLLFLFNMLLVLSLMSLGFY